MPVLKNCVIYNENLELPGVPPKPKKRGRPVTGHAKSNAQRQADYRKRKGLESLTVLLPDDILTRLEGFMLARDESKSQVVERALRLFFRKR
jgi:hypothetical protein